MQSEIQTSQTNKETKESLKYGFLGQKDDNNYGNVLSCSEVNTVL